ncbi:heavy metal translocating P-type ATPase [Vibrio sonorensis]|uniref:heavy metal translocating P-type ATPase n=1 Tax=Vibrio sonorensis TaxID=1004316 RepID=UPI0008DA15C1|nr:heavy metal translocating P-type ATPase [Vibrio sonorensis]
MQQITMPLAGLNCMGCARKVEKALLANHKVSLSELSPSSVEVKSNETFADMALTISELGYHAGHHYQLNLSGLNCQRCVAKLENTLTQNFDIGEFSASKTFLSCYSILSQEQLIDLIASLGYQAQPFSEVENTAPSQPKEDKPEAAANKAVAGELSESYSLIIEGMTCASCVASVESALMSVPNVTSAQVNLAESTAIAWVVQKSKETQNAIIKATSSAGYIAEVLEDPQIQQNKQLEVQLKLKKSHLKNATLGMSVGAPLMLWGMLGGSMMIQTQGDQIGWGLIGIVCLQLLATAGRSFFVNAFKSITYKRATMDTLVALGTGAAWFYSMLIVMFPDWFPAQARHVYFEASAMIIGLISLGHYIEAKAKAKTTRSLQALLSLQPKEATVIEGGKDKVVAIDTIAIGNHIRIKPGDKVPVDGKVRSGESYVDESMLTGEPIPVSKSIGDSLSAGTINQDGALIIEAVGVGNHTMLARIITMVRKAQSSKPQIAKLADQISAVFVPIVVVIAIISAIVWYLYGPDPKASYMLVVTTTVLIIACPCALGLATPLSVTVGIGKAAEKGILIRDAEVLQSASKIDTVVFDKTGTLTQGKPEVQLVVSADITQGDLVRFAASAEQHSEHPLAKAVLRYAKEQKTPLVDSQDFINRRGKGISAVVENKQIEVVSLANVIERNISLKELETEIEESIDNAWTPVCVLIEGGLAGFIAISDPVRPDAKQTIKHLQHMGMTTIMLTGDNQKVASAIAANLGIDQVISEVLPDQKASHIDALKSSGKIVAMVGDGVNDAPALATANIGIAMGSGSDVAIESAQVTLLNSSPILIANVIELSKATVKNMKQNLFGAFIYNSLGIPIAAGVLYPLFGFLLSPVVAGAAMALSSITVVSNANRLRLAKISEPLQRSK